MKQRIVSAKAVVATEVKKTHETPCSFEIESKVLRLTLVQKEAELVEKVNELACLQAKYDAQTENFANLQVKYDLLAPNENVKLGDNLLIAPGKLALCRDKDPSKFVGDLLEVYYGRDILANACLKGVKKTNTEVHILDSKIIEDVVSYTVTKFGVPIGIVRQAIRQKLNTCHKRGKSEKSV